MFIHHLLSLDKSSLANEIFSLQKNHNLPGFVKEGRQLIEKFSLPNIIDDDLNLTKFQWKRMVKCAVNKTFESLLKNQISQSSKLKDGPMATEKFEEKGYLTEMSMNDARMCFRIRSKTNNLRMNQQSDKHNAKNLWKCTECGNIDTQSHILWCPFFANLREGKSMDNDLDLVNYFREAFKIREEKKNLEL